MISREEMREWLKKKIGNDTEWMKFIEGLNSVVADEESFRPGYIETKQGVEIYLAILAALDGPSQQESYSPNWKHCMIHLNPKTGEMHSDGDHSVRHWIEDRIKLADATKLIKTALDGPSAVWREAIREWIDGKLPTLRFISENNKSQDAQYHARRDIEFFLKIRAVIQGNPAPEDKE